MGGMERVWGGGKESFGGPYPLLLQDTALRVQP